jgi:hypothetical protein
VGHPRQRVPHAVPTLPAGGLGSPPSRSAPFLTTVAPPPQAEEGVLGYCTESKWMVMY